jgi:hypothetical protein
MNDRPRTEAELIELVRSSDLRAPDALHRRIEELVAERSPSRGRRPVRRTRLGVPAWRPARMAGAAAALAAVLVAVLVVGLGGGGRSLSVQQATALTLSPARAPAPPESSSSATALVAAVQGVHFPYWGGIGWHSTGQRTDSVSGHTVTTVFYANPRGQRIGYAIVTDTATRMSGGTVLRRNGTVYRLFSGQSSATVVWVRKGHCCVLSGRGVDTALLLHLASLGQRGSAA